MAKNDFKFYTCYDVPPEVPSSPGRDLVPTYREVKEDGKPGRLEFIGNTSMDDQIQSWAASVSLADKIARFQSGDTDALFTNGGFYADLTGAPTSLAEAVKSNINLMESYEGLPKEVRDVFGSFDEFKQSCLDRSFDSKVNKAFAEMAKKVEVKDNGEAKE